MLAELLLAELVLAGLLMSCCIAFAVGTVVLATLAEAIVINACCSCSSQTETSCAPESGA